jgi:hypothetical protein
MKIYVTSIYYNYKSLNGSCSMFMGCFFVCSFCHWDTDYLICYHQLLFFRLHLQRIFFPFNIILTYEQCSLDFSYGVNHPQKFDFYMSTYSGMIAGNLYPLLCFTFIKYQSNGAYCVCMWGLFISVVCATKHQS